MSHPRFATLLSFLLSYSIFTSLQQIQIEEEKTFPQAVAIELVQVDDLTQLPFLHEPALLQASITYIFLKKHPLLAHILHQTLQERFSCDRIYSFSGPILIAVNPYKSLPIYSAHQIRSCASNAHRRVPHVFSIADQAYREMISLGQDQSILVSGESGSGKVVFLFFFFF